MSGDELQVDPADLNGKANQIRGLEFASMSAQPALISPDALIISSIAITNISLNAESLWAFQEYGRVEGTRLAQTLDNVAAAYAEVDRMSGQDIGDTMGTPGGAGGGSVVPKGVDIPALPHPPKMPIPKGQLAPDPMLDPIQTQTALDAGDDAASLRAAATMWRQNATTLDASAQQFETNSLLWEGQAADAAYAKFNSYRDWLVSLADSWKKLAGEAEGLADAHDAAKSEHRPIADEYRKLYEENMSKPLDASVLAAMERMAQLQGESEELRNKYARDGQPNQVEAQDPPSPVVPGTPVTVDDHRRARKQAPEDGTQQGGGAGGGAGQQPAGGGQPQTPQTPQEAPVSPMSAADPAQQAAQQAAQQGGSQGGSPGGGQPGGSKGGGSPSGGSPGGGMPTTGKGEPRLPTDPSLRPAAAGGGSAGGGGGGGGGGVPSSPLQPAVGAETVAPTPVVPGAPIPVASGGSAGGVGGAMGGGMGGMAPMHGGGMGGAGEKKRNPQLSQDEPLYVEDRPHTEQVIGVRPRRRGAPDDAKKGDTQ